MSKHKQHSKQPSNKQASTNNKLQATPKTKAGKSKQKVSKACKQTKAKTQPDAEAEASKKTSKQPGSKQASYNNQMQRQTTAKASKGKQ